MITQSQVKKLAQDFQIDHYSVYREYLQLVILANLFTLKNSENLIFKGGTALRIVYQSPRFSEDLDFNANCEIDEVKEAINNVLPIIQKTIPSVHLKYIDSLSGLTAKLYLPLEISSQELTVKLDFSFREKIKEFDQIAISTIFPVQTYPLIGVMTKEEILAEKVGAILTRDQTRDLYDFWWLLNTGTIWNKLLIEKKMKTLNISYSFSALKERIANYSSQELSKRLNKFLPVNNREVIQHLPSLLENLLETIPKKDL